MPLHRPLLVRRQQGRIRERAEGSLNHRLVRDAGHPASRTSRSVRLRRRCGIGLRQPVRPHRSVVVRSQARPCAPAGRSHIQAGIRPHSRGMSGGESSTGDVIHPVIALPNKLPAVNCERWGSALARRRCRIGRRKVGSGRQIFHLSISRYLQFCRMAEAYPARIGWATWLPELDQCGGSVGAVSDRAARRRRIADRSAGLRQPGSRSART